MQLKMKQLETLHKSPSESGWLHTTISRLLRISLPIAEERRSTKLCNRSSCIGKLRNEAGVLMEIENAQSWSGISSEKLENSWLGIHWGMYNLIWGNRSRSRFWNGNFEGGRFWKTHFWIKFEKTEINRLKQIVQMI